MTDEGELIAGRYRLVSRVGRGSMGVVWRAHDERLDRVVAVKQLLIAAGADEADAEEAVLRAMREARVAARVRHPHAITVHDIVAHQGKPCLVMEFLEAESLTALLARLGPLRPDQVARVGAQMASALAMAHQEGIVHRDVTPANVLITADGNAKLADFGISRAVGEGTVTGSGFIVGTPAYLAPEVAGGELADFPSDVFSLGATLYFALEGGPPYGTDENPIALLQRVAREEIVPPLHHGPLADVLLRLLDRDPEERPTMLAAHHALSAVAQGRPVPSLAVPRQATRLVPFRRQRWGRRLAVAAMIGVLALCGTVLATAMNSTGTPRPPGTAAATQSAAPPPPGTAPGTETGPSSADEAQGNGCEAQYRVINSWQGGYQVEVIVHNDDQDNLNGWSVTWSLPDGHSINNVWDGTLRQHGSSVTVTNANYNAVVKGHGSTSFGLVASVHGNRPAKQVVLTCQET